MAEKREPSQRQALAAARGRTLRGKILRLLQEQAGEPLNFEILLGSLERLHYLSHPDELRQALAYLRSRGYVEFEELRSRERPRVRIIRIRITASGTDLLEATIADEGVDVE